MTSEVQDALVVIFQISLDFGAVPKDPTMGNVTPLFKKWKKNVELQTSTPTITNVEKY